MPLCSIPQSDSLHRSLSLCHDQGRPPLVVRSRGVDVEVLRVDGGEPSGREQREGRARALACTDDDQPPTVRLRAVRVGNEVVMIVAD